MPTKTFLTTNFSGFTQKAKVRNASLNKGLNRVPLLWSTLGKSTSHGGGMNVKISSSKF